MGIQSSSATFSRFFVPKVITEDFWSLVDEKIHAARFVDCEDGQELAIGFSSWDDLFDSEFAFGSYHKGEYVAFNFRMDQRKVPPIILKQHVRRAVEKYRQEHEGRWPSRQERIEINENIQNWLLTRVLPQPSHCEVVWNSAANWMLLGTTSTRTMDAALGLFERHFGVYPVPLYHLQWALNMVPLDGRQKDTLASMVSIKSANALNEGRFLGYEFLTWLWFYSEQSAGKFKLNDQQTGEVFLGERLVLSLPGEGKEKVVCTTQANALYEARTALRQGKSVEEMQLLLRIGENEYFLTLDSSLWAIKGLKTPRQLPGEEDDEADGLFLEKMFFIEQVSSALDALYSRFLIERLSPGWDSDVLPACRQWIDGKTEESAPF